MGSGVEEAGGSPHAWGRVPASPLGGNPVSAAAPNLPSLYLFLSLFLALLSLFTTVAKLGHVTVVP